LLNTYRFCQLNLRLFGRQLMNVVQRDPMRLSIPEVSGDGQSEHARRVPTLPDQNLMAIPISSPYN
jgi:hypothetical protein